MILFGLRGVGSGNSCLPAISILKDQGITISIYAEEPAYSTFRDKFELIPEGDVDSILESVKPSLIVVTCATVGGAVPIDMMNKADKRGLPVILAEDMRFSHTSFNWNILPRGVCVVDELAKNWILQSWPGYPESHIHITGAPVFDKFANFKIEPAKHKLREVLGLNNDWPIVFIVGENWGMTIAVSMLVNSLNSLNVSVYLILRDHPTMVAPNASDEYKRLYAEYIEVLRDLKVGKLIDSSRLTSTEVLAGSDLVVGICSTMLEEACYLRKSVINIWTPEIGQILFSKACNTYEEQPITSLGGSLKAQNIEGVISSLKKIFNGDTAATLQAQEKHFQADGFNGRRLAEAILGYYKPKHQ